MFEGLKKKLPELPLVVIEQSLKRDIDDIVCGLWPDMKLAVVDDENTAAAAGDRIFKALSSRFECAHVTLPSGAVASDEMLSWVRTGCEKADALVAVGSGSINDLCKYVSHKSSKPYLVIPTAASMNGYVSANASIRVQGYKQTLPGHMPKAVLCDMKVICAAPIRLNRSGLCDSLARSTAQADWLLSHLVLGTDYDDDIYTPLLEIEEELLQNARGIVKSDAKSLEILLQTLLISGFGMTIAGGSYPASQAEHMVAHTYGMMKSTQPLPRTYHGEEIGVTVLTMARMQEELLRGKPVFRHTVFDEQQIKKNFGTRVTKEARDMFEDKVEWMKNKKGNVENWQDIANKIDAVTLSVNRLQRVLEELEAPINPEMLEWNAQYYKTALNSARFMRDRFTFLDLV